MKKELADKLNLAVDEWLLDDHKDRDYLIKAIAQAVLSEMPKKVNYHEGIDTDAVNAWNDYYDKLTEILGESK